MKKSRRKIFAVMLATVLCIYSCSSITAFASAMTSFPTQNQNSHSARYTAAIQVMMLNYNTTTRSIIQNSGGVDGSFGPATANAIKAFQTGCNITADGSCGPTTWSYLYMTITNTSTSGGYKYYSGRDPYTVYCMKYNTSNQYWYCNYSGSWHYVG